MKSTPTAFYLLAIAMLAPSVVIVSAFQHPYYVQPITNHNLQHRTSLPILPKCKRGGAIRVATLSAETSPNEAVLRQLDRMITKYQREQQKYHDRLSNTNIKLEKFRETKEKYFVEEDDSVSHSSFSETNARSLVKSMMWRLIAGSVTFLTSLNFSESLSTALSIVGSDFFSKAATMFVGERLMNKSQAGRMSGADDVGRSLAKALVWRVFAIMNTLTMSFFIAGDLSMASKIAGSDAIFKTGLMFMYERVWATVEWGKEYYTTQVAAA